MNDETPFVMSIEETEGKSRIHAFHLGTDEQLARKMIEIRYDGMVRYHMPVITIALMRHNKIIDVYNGRYWLEDSWSNIGE